MPRVPPIVHDVLHSPGQPLAANVRTFYESRFGHDFTRVRVHTDTRAAESARAVDATAYTVGEHVVFAAGAWAPHSRSGRELFAHELTHTIQQRGTSASGLEQLRISDPADSAERSADLVAQRFSTGPTPVTVDAAPAQVARQSEIPAAGDGTATEEAGEFQLTVPPLRPPERPPPSLFPPGRQPTLKLASFCTKTILAEGTCQHLALNSKYICCDPEQGYKRPGRTTSVAEPGKSCPSEKWTPIFTCDKTCKKALEKGCDDDDHWMAPPKNQFTPSMCGDRYTVCANGRSTWGYVRDKSITPTRHEVSPGIQKALGIPVGETFQGAVYPSDAGHGLVNIDPCCNGALLRPVPPFLLGRVQAPGTLQRQTAPPKGKPKEKPKDTEREVPCTQAQKEVIARGVADGTALADEAATAMGRITYPGRGAALKKHFGDVTSGQEEAIRGRYERIRDALAGRVTVCLDHCIRSTKHKIECARGQISGNLIQICPDFGGKACDPGVTMLHEAVHNDGARGDIDTDGDYPPKKNPEDNAYSYENFALGIRKGPQEFKLRPKKDVEIVVPEH